MREIDMKNIRFYLSLLCIIFVFQLCSCGWLGGKRYVCKVDDVKSVQIVRLGEFLNEDNKFEYTLLAEISNYKGFVEQLNKIDCSVWWGDPYPIGTSFVVIKIEYTNGDFDLIDSTTQLFYRSGKYASGYFDFDDGQIKKLINAYTLPKPEKETDMSSSPESV